MHEFEMNTVGALGPKDLEEEYGFAHKMREFEMKTVGDI